MGRYSHTDTLKACGNPSNESCDLFLSKFSHEDGGTKVEGSEEAINTFKEVLHTMPDNYKEAMEHLKEGRRHF